MNTGKPAKPGGMKAAYETAYQRACGEIRGRDLEELCVRSGAALNGRRIRLSFFGAAVQIDIPENGELEFQPPELPLVERILLLHYLLGREAGPARGVMVAFKNLPGASFYDPTYQKRGPRRIARRFGEDAGAFRRAGRSLGWKEAELGDASFRLDVFPRIRALVVLHTGDEEFQAEVNILFSDEIVNFLPLEDVAVLAGLLATRLGNSAQ
jgi:hypothetical protein